MFKLVVKGTFLFREDLKYFVHVSVDPKKRRKKKEKKEKEKKIKRKEGSKGSTAVRSYRNQKVSRNQSFSIFVISNFIP